MKSIFLSILLLLGLLSNATTYYFSNTVAYSGAATGDVAHPFRNPSAMDSILRGIYPGITSVAGDQFLFKRGDVFSIIKTIAPTKNGTADNPYIIDAYGSGNDPVFTSMQRLSNWTSMGGNKYRAQVPGSGNTVTSLILGSSASDGVFQSIGRWPNRDAIASDGKNYGGYLDIESSPATDQLVDNNYTAETTRPTDDWTGAEIAIRNAHFRFIKKKVSSNSLSGAIMTYTLSTTDYYDNGIAGWGYFFQNSVACLDKQGEWSNDPAKDSVYIYLVNSPTNYYIQVPTVDRIIDFGNQDYYVVNSIDFWGSNESMLYAGFSSANINVTNCSFVYAGENAIQFMAGGHFIDGNYIDYALSKAIETYSGDAIITNNIIKNTMPVNGMNFNVNSQGTGIDAYGDNVVVQYNKIYNSAYSAIDLNSGSFQHAKQNYIDSALVRVDDGGVIYTVNQHYENQYIDKSVDSNILLNTYLPEAFIGLPRKYNQQKNSICNALYGDLWTNRWRYVGNIVVDPQVAMYINDAYQDTMINNIYYNYKTNGFVLWDPHPEGSTTTISSAPNKGLIVNNPAMNKNYASGNVYYSNSTSTTPPAAESFNKVGTNVLPLTYGTFENQVFIYPMSQTTDTYFANTGSNAASRTWSSWNTTLKYDGTKNIFRRVNPTGATASTIGKLIFNDKKYDSVIHLEGKTWIEPSTGKEYLYDTAVLAPFTGRVLVYTAKTVLPLANTPPQVSLTNPINNAAYTAPAFIILQASASDADGTIASVDFYNNNVLLGSGTLSNGIYNYEWFNIGAGAYALKAVAKDNNGATTASAVSTIIVVDPPSSYKSSTDTYKTRGIKFYKKTK